MTALPEPRTRRESLNIRIRPEEKILIDRAVQARGQNRTDFILGAARRAAEDALLDRTILPVSQEAYEQWLERLDAPPQPNEKLRRALHTPAPWE